MALFEIVFKSSVHKDLRSLSKDVVARVWDKIEALRQQPLGPQAVKLSGAERLYRLRVGDYRVIYEVDQPGKVVTVHYVRHRREVYRGI